MLLGLRKSQEFGSLNIFSQRHFWLLLFTLSFDLEEEHGKCHIKHVSRDQSIGSLCVCARWMLNAKQTCFSLIFIAVAFIWDSNSHLFGIRAFVSAKNRPKIRMTTMKILANTHFCHTFAFCLQNKRLLSVATENSEKQRKYFEHTMFNECGWSGVCCDFYLIFKSWRHL